MDRNMVHRARDVLNELRWREPGRLADVVITYRDRTRREGFRTFCGSDIVSLERRYFTTKGGRLPYYKIERIEEAGRVLFQRETQGSKAQA